MFFRPAMWLVPLFVTLGASPCLAQNRPAPPELGQLLSEVRHPLEMSGTTVSGEGGEVLKRAVADAKYIAIGEDHVTREIPQLVSALCDLVPPPELSRLVLEIGPEAARKIDEVIRRPDRLRRMAELNTRYPGFVAFLDTRDDNNMAAHCGARSRDSEFRIVGLDQEYVGAAGFLLDAILKERLSPAAAAVVRKLRALEVERTQASLASGDATKLLLLTLDDQQMREVESMLEHGGTPRARALFYAIRTSAEIYVKNRTNAPDSNLVRALLMKRNYDTLPRPTGKTILKFGDWHLYKGVNPLGERDLGNHIAEAAEGHGEISLHILVLGAQGVHAFPEKFGQPLAHQPFNMQEDRDYHWLKPALDRRVGTGATLFDLRALRHRRIAGVDTDWRRVIDGYDLMIILPQLSPSETITH